MRRNRVRPGTLCRCRREVGNSFSPAKAARTSYRRETPESPQKQFGTRVAHLKSSQGPNIQVTTGSSLVAYQAAKATSPTIATKTTETSTGGIVQANEDGASGDSSAVADFLKYAKMNPLDRMRAGILKSMNLTDADLAKMTPDSEWRSNRRLKMRLKSNLKRRGNNPVVWSTSRHSARARDGRRKPETIRSYSTPSCSKGLAPELDDCA